MYTIFCECGTSKKWTWLEYKVYSLDLLDNFELTGNDEITLKGFLDLHVMTAEDEEGGEAEIWDILDTMGYNKQLQLDQVRRDKQTVEPRLSGPLWSRQLSRHPDKRNSPDN